MREQAGVVQGQTGSPVTILTWVLLSFALAFLCCLVLLRHGNLAWDDADYLRRGLADSRYAMAGSNLAVVLRLLDRLIHEQPKPPLLVAWIALGTLVAGRSQIDLLMVYASVVPFLLLALGAVGLARRYGGAAAGLLALALLLASPRALAFGGKVMVETMLALWLLLSLALAGAMVEKPGRRSGIALGLTVGLALLTKLTAVLLLAGALVPFVWWMFRPGPDELLRRRSMAWAVATCLAVAGPWYVCNARRAVQFGAFSARYNLVAEGQSRIVPAWDRLAQILGDLPGWPVLATLGVVGFGTSIRRSRPALESVESPAPAPAHSRFRVLVAASTLVAAGTLMFPAYFDTRFLLPLWPSIAVALGSVLAEPLSGLTFRPRAAVVVAFAACLIISSLGVVQEPASTTCWAARGLIDQIVREYGVATLANVGNIADWNVCKTGLINELRENPADCFVLHDLSAEAADGLRARLPRFDAVVILEPEAFPDGFLSAVPGLNRLSVDLPDDGFRPGLGTARGIAPTGPAAALDLSSRHRQFAGSQDADKWNTGPWPIGFRPAEPAIATVGLLALGVTVVTPIQHAKRMGFLMVVAAGFLAWGLRHTEAIFGDGLRSIHQAEQLDRGDWRDGLVGSLDHPVHPLGLVAAHGLVGGEGPVSWQQAGVALGFGCLVLLVIPLYLLACEAFGDEPAWLGCVLVVASPILGMVLANLWSESSFLLFWTWGLWAAVRFLRAGRFVWLPLTIVFGVLAYLSRPEGLLLPLAMILTLAILPLNGATRIHWPRWRAAMGFLLVGSLVLSGPFMALKGGVATRPAIARVLGLAAEAPPQALEREQPLAPGQTVLQTYRIAADRMLRVVSGVVTLPLLPMAVLGLVVMRPVPARARVRLFLGIILVASAIGLIRLHATGGYCGLRHGLIPGMILILAAAHGVSWLLGRISLPAKWLGTAEGRLRPGPVVWAALLAALIVTPWLHGSASSIPGPFHVYRDAGTWLAENAGEGERALDLSDWSLYFSRRPGYDFADLYEVPADSRLRWLIARQPDLQGHWNYSAVVRRLVGRREPVARIPADARPGQLQLLIYDRLGPPSEVAATDRSAATLR